MSDWGRVSASLAAFVFVFTLGACVSPRPVPSVCRAEATCQSWKCAAGRLTQWTVVAPDGGTGEVLEGVIESSGRAPVRVTARALGPSQATAEYRTDTGCSASVVLESDARGTVQAMGVSITGQGSLSGPQLEVLRQLQGSDLGDALVIAPLELGCEHLVPRAGLAALLMPWQVMLKFDPERAPAIRAVASRSSCGYFAVRRDDAPSVERGPMILGPRFFLRCSESCRSMRSGRSSSRSSFKSRCADWGGGLGGASSAMTINLMTGSISLSQRLTAIS